MKPKPTLSYRQHQLRTEEAFLSDVRDILAQRLGGKLETCIVKHGITCVFLDIKGTDLSDMGVNILVSLVDKTPTDVVLCVNVRSVRLGDKDVDAVFKTGEFAADVAASVIFRNAF